MAFTYGVAAGGQGDGFLIVHRHTGERDAHVVGGFLRIRVAVHPFRVNVDQAHHDCGQRIFQIALAGVTATFAAARRQPLFSEPQ
ncbi:hypothetical protein O0544_01760 [Edwardsiella anguillarum]|nr:hypothetical protein [Edwardsiella anguillarum]